MKGRLSVVGVGVGVATLLIFALLLPSVSSHDFPTDGTVLELHDSNFDSAISAFDFIFVDFYAPWCGHCKRLAPELDAAAPVLAGLNQPIVIAKVNADKYTRLASKYDIDGFPTLKLFIHGVPMDYNGPRKADLLVRFLKKFVAPDVSVLASESAISTFVEAAGTDFPIYIGFGMNESIISNFAVKYKKKAWFSVAKDFSEEMMVAYDFDRVPALVSLHPSFNERSVFYGPFDGEFLEDFIRQNLFPLALPINHDTLKLLRDDDRKIVLTFVDDESDEKSKKFVNLLKAAASANRDLVFGFIGIKQWGDFADSFGINKKTELPKMVVWDGDDQYIEVIGSESIEGIDQGTQITRFLEGYREGRTLEKKIGGLSLIGYINSLIGIRTVYIIVFIVLIMMIIQTINKEEHLTVGRGEGRTDHGTSSPFPDESMEVYQSGDKED